MLGTLKNWLKKGSSFDNYLSQFVDIEQLGENISMDTAMGASAVFACIKVISNGVAQVPLKFYRQTSTGKEPANIKQVPQMRLFQRRPNNFQTPYDFKTTLCMHRAFGNAYVYVSGYGTEIQQLIPLDPSRVTVIVNPDYSKSFKITRPSGEHSIFGDKEVWHIPGPSWGGAIGDDVMRLASKAIGLSNSAESQHIRLHKNGLQTSGIISYPEQLKPDQFQARQKWIKEGWAGVANTGKPLFLDFGAVFTPAKLSGVDAEHLATRKHQIDEICRYFGVQPIMIGHETKTQSYSSVEQMMLAHVIHTLSPNYVAIEESIDANILTQKQQDQGYFCAFDATELLRGSLQDTSDYLNKLSFGGIMTRNECREKLDLNPIDGLDTPLTPTNAIQQPNGGKPA